MLATKRASSALDAFRGEYQNAKKLNLTISRDVERVWKARSIRAVQLDGQRAKREAAFQKAQSERRLVANVSETHTFMC